MLAPRVGDAIIPQVLVAEYVQLELVSLLNAYVYTYIYYLFLFVCDDRPFGFRAIG